MSVCHEVGEAMFDITRKSIRNYLYEPKEKVDKDGHKLIDKLYKKVHGEANVMEKQMRSLGHAYVALLAEHNKQKTVSKASPSKKVSSKKTSSKGGEPQKAKRKAQASPGVPKQSSKKKSH